MPTHPKTMRLAALLSSSLILTGCGMLADDGPDPRARRDAMRNSWLGHPAKELILEWGPPAKTDTDGDSGHIYSWRRYTEPQRTWDGRQILIAGYTTTYMFWADQAGSIYSWRYETE